VEIVTAEETTAIPKEIIRVVETKEDRSR